MLSTWLQDVLHVFDLVKDSWKCSHAKHCFATQALIKTPRKFGSLRGIGNGALSSHKEKLRKTYIDFFSSNHAPRIHTTKLLGAKHVYFLVVAIGFV